jgi:hypothetical protein
MLRSTTAPKATCVAESDMLMEKPRLAFSAAAFSRWLREWFALARPEKSAWQAIRERLFKD